MVSRPRSLWSPSRLLLFSISFLVLTSIQAISQTNTLVMNPSSIAFGNVAVGSTAKQSETVTNGFSSKLVLREITFSGSNFSETLYLPLALSAGQSATFPVSFTPTAAGTFAVTMTVKYRRPYNRHWVYGSSSIALQGTGITAGGSLTVSPTSINFGSVQISKTTTLPLTLKNSQTTAVRISGLSASGTGFTVNGFGLPIDLSAGQSVTVNVNFTPPATGTDNGSVTVTSNANNPSLSVSLAGTGVSSGQLAANPASMSFGTVLVSKTSTLSLTLTNNQTTTVQVSQIAASGTGFSVNGFTLPINLSAGQSVNVNVNFTPPASGTDTGSVTVTSNANNPSVSVTLAGTGAISGQLAVSPTTLSFGTVNVGSSKNMTGTLSASSNSVIVSSASWNGPGFSVSGISFPFTLAAGQSIPFTVTFAPQTAGSVTGAVSFLSNASNTPSNESLAGTGAQVTQHSVALTWNSSSGSVQGYYVYRGTQSGGPYGKISPLDATTGFTDASVTSGQTYYYVVTALGTNSVESAYSNETVAIVP